MNGKLLQDFQRKKQALTEIIDRATAYGWLTPEQQQSMQERLHGQTLTIGVIGQMKSGKSTFLNAFLFGDDVLPAATTPMTAALSVITYGPEKKMVAEFYSEEEWEEQKQIAARALDGTVGNEAEAMKVKAAKELVARSAFLGEELNGLLGMTKEDRLERLADYVGADGKYVPVTKAVTVYCPEEILKGVEVVDTPGFNDPIVSREERTKSFLDKADAVVLLLYAGRPFDAVDRDILFKDLRQCGVGKVIVGINKYDIPYENGDTEEEIVSYVKEEMEKADRLLGNSLLAEVMTLNRPVPFSAEMALLAQLPASKINDSEVYRYAWDRHCENFEITSARQMKEYSRIGEIETALGNLLRNEKEKTMFAKPLNTIVAAAYNRVNAVENEMARLKTVADALEVPDHTLEEKLRMLERTERRIGRKIEILGGDIDETVSELARKMKYELEDTLDDACRKMHKVIDEKFFFDSRDKLENKIIILLDRLKRDLRRILEDTQGKAAVQVKNNMRDFFDEAGEVMENYMPDFEARDFIKGERSKIQLTIDARNLFAGEKEKTATADPAIIVRLLSNVYSSINRISLGLLNKIFGNDDRELHEEIRRLNASVDIPQITAALMSQREPLVNTIKTDFISELFDPLHRQLESIRNEKQSRERRQKEAEDSLQQLTAEKKTQDSRMEELRTLVANLKV